MASLKRYGEYGEYLVAIDTTEKNFISDIETIHKVRVSVQDIKKGKVYGDFEKEDSRFQGDYIGAVAVDVGLFEKYGKYTECLYINFDDVILAGL